MSSVDSDVELRRFTSFTSQQTNNSSWNGEPKLNNPTYHSYDSERGPDVMDPTSSDRMYDVVPGEKHGGPPPPLPGARKTTPNAMYASRGETLHPNATLEKNMTTDYSHEGIEADIDHMSSKCLRVTCLSILVVASLFLAIVAVVLVLLLWFGVYVPDTVASSCPSIAPTQALTGNLPSSSSSIVPLPSPTVSSSSCLCPTPDLSPIISRIEEETANLTGMINTLDEEITQFKVQSNATDQSLISQSNSISSQVSEINSTCHETLLNLTSQNVSLAGLDFEAELRNVGVYSSCVYEYLSNCTIGESDNNCTTVYHNVLVNGYYNLDLACHVEIKALPDGNGGLFFAPLTNLRTEVQSGQSIDYSADSAEEILLKSQMRCECSLVALSNSASRSNSFSCFLFRSRCPSVSTFQNVRLVTP